MKAAWLRRLDDGVARGEAGIACALLVAMVIAAAAQAVLRNLSGRGIAAASEVLHAVPWIDGFLELATMTLAMLGASLAAHAGRHVSMDALQRFAPPRVRLVLAALAALVGAVVSVALARVFFQTLVLEGSLAGDLVVYDGSAPVHACEASARALQEAQLSRPNGLCTIRSAFATFGVKLEDPSIAGGFVVPVMFVFVAIRLLARSAGAVGRLARGELEDAPVAENAP